MADGRITIDVILDDKGAVQGISGLERGLNGVTGTAQKVTSGVGNIVKALGLVKIASAAFDVLKSSMGAAIDRVDTLNRFPQMMEAIGFSAEQSEKSITQLSDGIQGLPTRLDEVAATAQSIAILTGDLDKATQTTLALNNAFLASGSDAADAARGLQQYTQMLSRGEVDMQSWRTLQETMGVALNDTAKAFGFAGESAQNDLYDALKDGTITFDEFNDKIIELSEGVGGFAERALIASKGIRTSMKNIGTAVATGLGNIIQTVNDTMEAEGFGSIADNLDKVKVAVQNAFKEINAGIETGLPIILNAVKGIVDVIKITLDEGALAGLEAGKKLIDNFLSGLKENVPDGIMGELIDIILNISDGDIGLAKLKGIEIVNGLLEGLHGQLESMITFGTDVINNIVSGVIAGYPILMGASFALVDTLLNFILGALPLLFEAGTSIINNLSEGLQEALPQLSEVMTGAIESLFTTINERMPEVFEKGTEFLLELIKGIGETLPELVTTALEIATALIDGLVETLPELVLMGVDFLFALIQGIIDELPTIGEVAVQIINWLSDTIIENLPLLQEKGKEINDAIMTGIVEKGPDLIAGFLEIIVQIITALLEKLPEFLTMGFEMIVNLINGVDSKEQDLTGAMGTIIGAAIQAILDLLESFFESGSESMTAVEEGMQSVREALKNKAGELMQATLDKIAEFFSDMLESGKELASNVKEGISNKIGEVVDAVSSGIEDAYNAVMDWGRSFRDAGANIVGQIKEGLSSGWEGVKEKASGLAGLIRGHFPASPAKYGPLKTLHKSNFGEQIAKAIDGGEYDVQQSLNSVLTLPRLESLTPRVSPILATRTNTLPDAYANRGNTQDSNRLIDAVAELASAPIYVTVDIDGKKVSKELVDPLQNEIEKLKIDRSIISRGRRQMDAPAF